MPSLLEGLGAEQVIDEVFLVMREQFNDALAVQQELGDVYDQQRADRLGVAWQQLLLEEVSVVPSGTEFPYGNYHVGSIPSFVQTDDRVDRYPMLVVAPGRTVPDAEDASADQYDVYLNAVAIHCFARANPTEGPEVAYRRAMRMAEAVHQVVNSTTLRRLVSGVSGPSLVDRSEPWFFPATDGHGEDWCWQAVMHQYQVKNYSM